VALAALAVPVVSAELAALVVLVVLVASVVPVGLAALVVLGVPVASAASEVLAVPVVLGALEVSGAQANPSGNTIPLIEGVLLMVIAQPQTSLAAQRAVIH
jgi:hypothetical protein